MRIGEFEGREMNIAMSMRLSCEEQIQILRNRLHDSTIRPDYYKSLYPLYSDAERDLAIHRESIEQAIKRYQRILLRIRIDSLKGEARERFRRLFYLYNVKL